VQVAGLQRLRWEAPALDVAEKNVILEHLTQRFESLTIAAARRMITYVFGGIYEFWQDRESLFRGIGYARDNVWASTFWALARILPNDISWVHCG
jgi:hypothetical protein